MVGRTFTRLTVVRFLGRTKHRHSIWLCHCECGAETAVTQPNLVGNKVRSCGCLRADTIKQRTLAEPRQHAPHRPMPPAYRSWRSMLDRCYRPGTNGYVRYGGAGITVCAQWHSYPAFLADMGERPEGTTLDRKDGARPYEPGNCRWATATEQNRNRRTNHWLAYRGETKTLAEWEEVTGRHQGLILSRLLRGWSAADAIEQPSINAPLAKRRAA